MAPQLLPRVLSGIQPTADSFHLGNWIGAVQNWVALESSHDAYYCVVDLHAITAGHDPKTLHQRTLTSFAQLLAAGLDPDKCTLFVQSHVTEHAQLEWVLACLTGFGEASRMTQFKDKSGRSSEDRISVGLFTYPILMAADVLLYQANQVPVGEDQRQHLELTRDLAQRFNTTFGKTFTVPEAYIMKESAKILDLQDPTSKMSKSLPEAGCISLLDDPKVVTKRIKSAVTDSERDIRYDPENKPGISNLLVILASLTHSTPQAVADTYAGKGYGDLKADVADAVVTLLVEPFSARTNELLSDPTELQRIMAKGAAKARVPAAATLRDVFDKVGFVAAALDSQ
jgi:tryptophanyl-tRNA synthetase